MRESAAEKMHRLCAGGRQAGRLLLTVRNNFPVEVLLVHKS